MTTSNFTAIGSAHIKARKNVFQLKQPKTIKGKTSEMFANTIIFRFTLRKYLFILLNNS